MQRSDERDSERRVERGDPSADDAGGRTGLRGRTGSLFSVRFFLLSLAVLTAGLVAGSFVPLVGIVGRFVGLFVGAFALGLLSSRRRYLETGAGGALASGLGFLLSAFDTVLIPVIARYGAEIAGVGVGAGLLVSLAGHYFGRDLRTGLTRDL